MNLRSYFQKYNLTNDQKSAVKDLDSFLSSGDQYFILKGYAGTGKTFLMKGLTEYLTLINRKFRIAAPTGRAAKIIYEKTKQQASTIHKMIYSQTMLQEVENKGRIESLKLYFDLHLNDDPINTVYIIDEASMIANIKDESEFLYFGTGHLLSDMIAYVNPNSNSIRRKIIFIGDSAQLPPINMNHSPALSDEYLIKNFGGNVTHYELKEVVRHKAESGILNNATYIRNSFLKKTETELKLSECRDVFHLKTEDLLSKYIFESGGKINRDQIIVAYSNSSVKEFNELIRCYYFPDKKVISKNDLILITKNNYNYSVNLFNGDFGKVHSVEPESETKTIIFKKRDNYNVLKTYNIPLIFRNVILIFQDLENNNQLINCKIIENLLFSKNGRLTSEEQIALYVDFKNRNPKLRPGHKVFKEELNSDPYFNALQIKFGYAVTCHKAQGGEWEKVFVDCDANIGKSNSSYFRWLYTAITRATNKLYVLNPPRYVAGSKMKIHKELNNPNVSESIIVYNRDDDNVKFEFPLNNPFLKMLYFAVIEKVISLNIEIESIQHKQYCEHYYFSKESQRSLIQFYYNKQNKITRILKNDDSEFSNLIVNNLSSLVNKEIISRKENSYSIEENFKLDFPNEFPFLKDLYDNISSILEKENIRVTEINHFLWRERYKFTKGNYKAFGDFTYNKKGKFRFMPIAKESNSEQLITEISKILEQL